MFKKSKRLIGLCLGVVLSLGVGVGLGNTHGEAVGVSATSSTSVAFGSKQVEIKSTNATFTDSAGTSWTVTTEGTKSFTNSGGTSPYVQIGKSSEAASSISLVGNFKDGKTYNITNFSTKWGGFSGTTGTIVAKVGGTQIASDKLSGTSDVTISQASSSSVIGDNLTISVTGISKGVKLYSLSYSYEEAVIGPSVTIQDNITFIDVFKGKTNSDVKVKVSNIDSPVWSFTYDESEVTGKETSDFISLTHSDLVSDISTLSIVGNEIGTTVIHISVSGTECTSTLTVNVVACPASINVSHSDITDGKLEIETGKYKQLKDFSGLDTDGNEYAIGVDDVSYSVESEEIITVAKATTFKITGSNVGTTTIKFYLTKLEDVSTTLTVAVLDDFQEEVKSITFNENLTSEANTNPVEGIFKTRTAKTHFGETETIAFEDFTFSYSDDRTTAVAASEFKYDLEHGTLVDGSDVNKLQTIYVFAELDTEKSYSYDITITHKFITGLVVDGKEVESGDYTELNILRNTTKQLDVKVTPTDTTQDQTILYSVTDDTTDGKITVDDNGLITVGNVLGELAAVVKASSKANPDLSYEFYINATLEEMSIRTGEPEYWENETSSLSIGDEIVIYNESAKRELTGIKNDVGTATTYSDTPNCSYVLKVAKGYNDKTFALYDGSKYLALTKSDNKLHTATTISTNSSWTITFSNGSAKIVNASYTSRTLMYNGNNTTERFCCYGSGVQNTYLVQLYKRHGGIKSITVESDLITAIETFMSPTNFECDPNGQTFDSEAWSNNSMFTSDLISKYDLAHVKADQSGNEVEQFLYKYDLVIWKMNNGYSAYKDATDFLGRLSLISTSNSNQIFRNSDNNTAILIVVLVSFASVTAIGGYFFIRKRKYN